MRNKAKLAQILFIFAAFVSFVASVSLWFSGSREEGMFVGLWVPSILALGALTVSALSKGATS